MAEKRNEGLLVRADPLEQAERISRLMVGVRVVDGALLLDADPAWAGAINTVLVMKGVRVRELRPLGRPQQTGLQQDAVGIKKRIPSGEGLLEEPAGAAARSGVLGIAHRLKEGMRDERLFVFGVKVTLPRLYP